MRFLSNFGSKITFMCSVNFWHQQEYNSLFKGSIGHVTSQCKRPIDETEKLEGNQISTLVNLVLAYSTDSSKRFSFAKIERSNILMDQFALSTRGKQQFKAEWRSLTHVLTVVSYGSDISVGSISHFTYFKKD